MNVMGLNFGYSGSVTIVKDGVILSHIVTADEVDKKLARGVTKAIIKKALDIANLRLKDIDMTGIVNWYADREPDGTEMFDKIEEGFSITNDQGIEFSLEDYVKFYNNNSMVAQGTFDLNIGDQKTKGMIVDHLFAHCAYAYITSPFENAVGVCIDTMDGMSHNNAIYHFNDDGKQFRLWRRDNQFSVLNIYNAFTDLLGYYPAIENLNVLQDLAKKYKKDLKELDRICWPQVIQMGDIFHGDMWTHLSLYNNNNVEIPERREYYPLLDGEGIVDDLWWEKSDIPSPETIKFAASVQYVTENSVKNYIEKIVKTYPKLNVCVGGKVTMNEGAMKYVKGENVFSTPSHNDEELSAGAALFIADQLTKNKKKEVVTNEKRKNNSSLSHIKEL